MDDQEKQRELTADEKARMEIFNAVRSEYEAKGYCGVELTVGLVFANIAALLWVLPFLAIFLSWYLIANDWTTLLPAFESESTIFGPLFDLAVFFAVYVVLVVVHEFIHGLTWAAVAPTHSQAIRFGFIKEYATPYCTCTEPISRPGYVLGALMPFFVLGIVPCVVGCVTGYAPALYMGLFMILGAGGDLTLVAKLLGHRSPAGSPVVDHPTQAGCVVFERR